MELEIDKGQRQRFAFMDGIDDLSSIQEVLQIKKSQLSHLEMRE